MKIIGFIKEYWKYITIIFLVIFLIISNNIKNEKISVLSQQNNILSVQEDSLKIYKNKLNETTYEKQSLTLTIKDLKNNSDILNNDNKKLLNKILALEKEKKVIAAVNISQIAHLDSILDDNPVVIDTTGHLIRFVKDEQFLKYNILVNYKSPFLLIQSLEQPNELFLSYSFNESGINVKVTNSNPNFGINNINSYIIPIKKQNKFKTAFKWGTIGIGVGVVGTLLLIN
jgi:hypothetical protein